MTYCDLCLPIFKNNYQQMATFRIFRRVQFEHTSNAMFCNFPLNFAVWPQPSRFLKAEIQICAFFGGVLRHVCRVLRLVCVHVSVLNVSICY